MVNCLSCNAIVPVRRNESVEVPDETILAALSNVIGPANTFKPLKLLITPRVLLYPLPLIFIGSAAIAVSPP